MKKQVLFALATMVLASCSSDGLVNNSSSGGGEAPIAFSVEKKNITRATNLETLGHYNFGVWAYKVNGKNSLADAEVMNNYLVGYSDESAKGYNTNGVSTYNKQAGTLNDHLSPWFYEHLGTSEYEDGSFGYKTTDTNYMSNNAHQYLRYWDLAYANTNFFCYAPYVKNDAENGKEVTFDHAKGEMKFADKTIRDGYDNPLNSTYTGFDRSLSEYMYAGVQATNSEKKDVIVPFKHMGAQVNVRFYESIPNYRVEIIDLDGDNGILATGVTEGNVTKGIQATPAVKGTGDSYTKGSYYTTNGATVTFDANATPTFNYTTDGSSTTSDNLMFLVPTTNLVTVGGHSVIPQEGDGKYSESPTVYYAVAQPTGSTTGFTFHISYRIIAEDNNEVITVHNATVFVPAKDGSEFIAAWQPNNKYTYTFKITKNSTGSTNPGTKIDPTDPTTDTTKSLYPIVFDGATIEDYSEKYPVSEVSGENTKY